MSDLRAYVQEMNHLMSEIGRGMRTLFQELPEAKGATPQQVFLMHKLREHGPSNASEIRDMMGVTSGSVTSITDRLIKHGFMERHHDEKDRRMVIFRLTKEGERVLDHISKFHEEQLLAHLFERLGLEKTKALTELLRDMRDVLQEDKNTRSDSSSG